MSKQALWLIIALFAFTKAKAQPYGNEWINYSQKYYKFPVIEDGVYRINYSTLVNAGVPVTGGVSPKNIQVFGRGREIPVYIEGEGDGVFNTSDFIEFYAQKNDGYIDTLLYENPSWQSNPYYSLINDTAWYFITWNALFSGNNRMSVSANNNFTSFASAQYVYSEQVKVFSNYYYQGPRIIGGEGEEGYMEGEGYVSDVTTNTSTPLTVSFTPINVATNGSASLKFNLITDATGSNRVNVSLNSNLLFDYSYNNFNLFKKSYTITPSSLTPNTSMEIKSIAVSGSSTGRIGIAFASLIYPHTLDFEGLDYFRFYMDEPSSQTFHRLDVSNFNGNGSTSVLYDLTTNTRITLYDNGSGIAALLPNANTQHHCLLFNTSGIKSVTSLTAVNKYGSSPGFFTNYATQTEGKKFLIVTHPSLSDKAAIYATHRTTKGLPAFVADIEELYEQFAHGIKKHPLAVKGFADYLLDVTTDKPEYLFLMGKSIANNLSRSAGANYENNLVPSWGSPASDNMLTSGINGSGWQPALLTGRLSAKSETEIVYYYDKVLEKEAAPREEWMKRVLNFAGGQSSFENEGLRYYISSFEDSLKGTYFGGRNFLFSKTTDQPIQANLPDSVEKLINGGVAIMNFFGHAAGSSFDVSIDYASRYDNRGKYPLLLANSCFAGDIHQPFYPTSPSTSEDWILTPNKGAIMFIANVGLGYPDALWEYSKNFYSGLAKKHYGKSVGYFIQQAVAKVQAQSPTDVIKRSTCFGMTLHGDPSLTVYPHATPDYEITESDIYFNPAKITSDVDSFQVMAGVTNIGKAIDSTVVVELTRKYPDGSLEKIYNKTVPHIYYKDTIVFTLPTESFTAAGNNSFCVNVNPALSITENDYSNNKTCAASIIRSDDIYPIYPYNYAIIDEKDVTLRASTGDPFAGSKNYTFEIDTNDTYQSPFYKSTTITSAGAVIEWKLPFSLSDSGVYFWRVSLENDVNKKEFSFQYIPEKRGWGQTHIMQHKHNDYKYMSLNTATRKFDFSQSSVSVNCKTFGSSTTYATGYTIDGFLWDYAGCGSAPQIHVVVIDTINFEPWATDRNDYGNNNAFINGHNTCNPGRTTPDNYFAFAIQAGDANGQQQALADFINNIIPNRYYVLVYTYVTGNFSAMNTTGGSNAIAALQSMGATINQFSGNVPYAFLGRKDIVPQKLAEELGNSPYDTLSLSGVIMRDWHDGSMKSVIAGPSRQWNYLTWRPYSLEDPSSDIKRVELYGLKSLNDDGTLLANFEDDSLDVYLTNYINASIYPFAKLNFYTRDDAMLSPAQLKYWRLYYEEVPEAAVDPKVKFSFNQSGVSVGDSVRFSVAIRNVSVKDMDSLRIDYWVVDAANQRIDLPYNLQKPLGKIRQKPLLKGDTMYTSISIPSNQFVGTNSLWLETNPASDQPEQFHFNNFAQVSFSVDKDKQNPLLDVTFDGTHIMDGDIVSAKPNILIALKDENKYLALADTGLFTIYLLEPDKTTPKRIYFYQGGVEQLKFTPAQLPNNTAKVQYNTEFPVDGKYKLIVQGSDVSNNRSGMYDYSISFEVINKSSITQLLNYPNPFSTATRFVFTLTGYEVPTYLKIQILTVTGKVVREIDLSELGYIHVGRNITEYAWDGTDQFGDKLAIGVYFYRVISSINGEQIENRATAADQYFKKGFGKMYLMR